MRISEKVVITRKSHKCFGCYRKFEKGECMKSETCVYDDNIYTLYCCKTCNDLMEEFRNFFFDDYEGVFSEGCITQIYYNYKVNNPEGLLMKLREQKYDLGRTEENRKDIKR